MIFIVIFKVKPDQSDPRKQYHELVCSRSHAYKVFFCLSVQYLGLRDLLGVGFFFLNRRWTYRVCTYRRTNTCPAHSTQNYAMTNTGVSLLHTFFVQRIDCSACVSSTEDNVLPNGLLFKFSCKTTVVLKMNSSLIR